MTAPPVRRVVACLLVLAGLVAGAGSAFAQEADGGGANPSSETTSGASATTVDVVEIVGVLDRALTDFATEAVVDAADSDVEAIVIRLDTPGALGGDVDALVAAIEASPVPVVTYVGTPGAVAYGAGLRVALASHVLALAPVTTVGVGTPQDLGDPDARSEVEVAELLADAAAIGGRDDVFAAEAAAGAAVVAVPDGEGGTEVQGDARLPEAGDPDAVRTLDEDDLVDAGIAEIVAPTLQGVLASLDGIVVTTSAGETELDVDAVTANVRFVNANLVVRLLHSAASPVLAYLLLLAGALALFFEVFQPGFGVSGVSAVGLLALGGYALTVIPVSPLWAVVALVGLLLLAYDLAVAGLGWPTALGAVLFGLGSWGMWPVAEVAPPTWLVVLGTLGTVAFFVLLMTSVLRAQGNQALLGAEQVEGKVGIVRSSLNPDGHVFVGGALWRARAPEGAGKVGTGTKVRVVGLNDELTLDVAVLADETAG